MFLSRKCLYASFSCELSVLLQRKHTHCLLTFWLILEVLVQLVAMNISDSGGEVRTCNWISPRLLKETSLEVVNMALTAGPSYNDAQSNLKSKTFIVTQHGKKFSDIKETEGPVPVSRKVTIGCYHTVCHLHTLFLEDPFWYYPRMYALSSTRPLTLTV
jgi:hypothetical protein